MWMLITWHIYVGNFKDKFACFSNCTLYGFPVFFQLSPVAVLQCTVVWSTVSILFLILIFFKCYPLKVVSSGLKQTATSRSSAATVQTCTLAKRSAHWPLIVCGSFRLVRATAWSRWGKLSERGVVTQQDPVPHEARLVHSATLVERSKGSESVWWGSSCRGAGQRGTRTLQSWGTM